MFPEEIRLNNPGGIEHVAHEHWEGMTRLQNNKKLVRFSTPHYGLRATMKTLVTYEELHGFHTITSIITRWAPPSENNTAAYIKDVSERTGIPPNILFDITDKAILISVTKAIVHHENGFPPSNMPPFWYTDREYELAAESALQQDEE